MAVPDATEAVWDRPEPPGRRAPAPLSRARIVAAALALADAEGLDGVSLRKVAASLDAGPMRLYGYVASKEELLDLLVDAVHAEIPLPSGTGRDALRELAAGLRAAVLRHEWIADLLGGRLVLGPHTLAVLEATLAALRPGRDADAVLRAGGVLNAYLVGALRREVAERRAERVSGQDEPAWQTAVGPHLTRMLGTGRYPTLDEVVRDADHPEPGDAFADGLERVLDGLLGGRRTR